MKVDFVDCEFLAFEALAVSVELEELTAEPIESLGSKVAFEESL